MAAKPLPDQALLLKLLRYEPETGKLFWRERDIDFFTLPRLHVTWNKRFSGKLASTLDPIGYHKVRILGQQYLAHRIIWKLVTGCDPLVIDHIDGVRSNNVFSNLRSVEPCQNARNMSLRMDKKIGCLGVTQLKNGNWQATIRDQTNGYINLGVHRDPDSAVRARKSAERQLGYHPNHGKRKQSRVIRLERDGLEDRDRRILSARLQSLTYREVGLMFDLDLSRVRKICIKEMP